MKTESLINQKAPYRVKYTRKQYHFRKAMKKVIAIALVIFALACFVILLSGFIYGACFALEVKKVDLSAKIAAMQTVKIDMSKAIMKPTTIMPVKVK